MTRPTKEAPRLHAPPRSVAPGAATSAHGLPGDVDHRHPGAKPQLDRGGRRPLFLRYPVTLLLLLQFLPLVVWPAVTHSSPYLRPMVLMIAIAILGAFTGESLLAPLRATAPPATDGWASLKLSKAAGGWACVTPRAAKTILIMGLVALMVAPTLGVSTYATQVGFTERSRFAPLVTPLTLWATVGLGLLLFCFWRGTVTATNARIWVAVAVSCHLVYVWQIGLIAPLASFTLTALAAAVFVGLLRLRLLVLAMVCGAILWPFLYEVRNDLRAESGGQGYYGQEITAADRLREDLLLEDALRIGHPLHAGQPSIAEAVRFGVLPRFIDPGRGELSTGRLLSIVHGRSGQSSSTATIVGNVFLFGGGMVAVFTVPFLVATVVGLLTLRPNPLSLTVVLAMWRTLVWIEAPWPDGIAGTLQVLVSALIALAFVKLGITLNDAMARRIKPSPAGSGRHRVRRKVQHVGGS